LRLSPQFINEEEPTAFLNNAAESFRLFGYPRTTLKQMIEWDKLINQENLYSHLLPLTTVSTELNKEHLPG